MMYRVFRTNWFDEEADNLSEEENKIINNIIEQLKTNPYVGDQLQIKSLREKSLKINFI